jgi:hypothetical protein
VESEEPRVNALARYSLFFGADASRIFGIPTMEDFPDNLETGY